MRHDLPRKIQLSAPHTPWYKAEWLKQVIELAVLGGAFTVASLVVRWAI